jgi:Transglutaminase-like superfamily
VTRLHRFVGLPATERRLVLEALALLWLLRLGLWLLPFRAVRPLLHSAPPTPSGLPPAGVSPERVAWAVAAASRCMPHASCLVQALATHLLLRRMGYPSSVRIGVRHDKRRRLAAHAWVESDGQVLVGGSDERYTPLVRATGTRR